MQSVLCIIVNLSLVLAFLQAPFLHVHTHESTDKHGGAFIHTHFLRVDGRQSTESELRNLDPDADAQFQKWFTIATVDSGLQPVILSCLFCLPAPAKSTWLSVGVEPNAHGPPLLQTIIPRAPPA